MFMIFKIPFNSIEPYYPKTWN